MDDSRRSEELVFRRLYFTYIQRSLEEDNCTFEDLKNRVDMLITAFEFSNGGKGLRDFDLNQKLNAYAYLNRLSPMSAGLVRERILTALKECEDFSLKTNIQELKILDLASGPGTDVVGFCSALYEKANFKCEKLDFTLVDCISNWKQIFQSLDDMIRSYDYGFVSKLFREKNISTDFLLLDLGSEPEKNASFLQKLMSADVILVIRLLLQFSDTGKSESLFDNIHSHMKPDALMVMIEPVTYINKVKYLEMKKEKFEKIYEYPKENSDGEPPEDYKLLPCQENEEYSEYQANLWTSSKCRVFVFKKIN